MIDLVSRISYLPFKKIHTIKLQTLSHCLFSDPPECKYKCNKLICFIVTLQQHKALFSASAKYRVPPLNSRCNTVKNQHRPMLLMLLAGSMLA